MLHPVKSLMNLLSIALFAITSASYATDAPQEEGYPRRYFGTETELTAYLKNPSPETEVSLSFQLSAEGCQNLLQSIPNLTRLSYDCDTVHSTDFISSLGQLKHLTHLNLSFSRFTKEHLNALADQIPGLTALESLNLHGCQIGLKETVFKALPHLSRLRTLNLHSNSIYINTIGDCCLFWGSLGKLLQLESLDIGENNIGFDGASGVCELFSHLKYFSLDYCSLVYQDRKTLVGLLPHMKNLETLRMSDNNLEEMGDIVYASALRTLPKLRDFFITNCSVAGRQLVYCALPIIPISTNIRELNFSGNQLDWESQYGFAETLKHCPGLEKLWLINCEMRDRDFLRLSEALPYLTQLADLDISENHMNAYGADILARKGLGDCTSLRRLALRNNPIGSRGLEFLTPVIARLTNLEVLIFSGNNTESYAAIAFAEDALIHLTKLKEFTMEECKISYGGIAALLATFFFGTKDLKASFPHLKEVNLRQSLTQGAETRRSLDLYKRRMPHVTWVL